MHGLALMKRKDNNAPFANIPSRETVERFDPTSGRPCCTAEHFQFDPLSFPRSPWNLSVADVFTTSFLSRNPAHSEKDVRDAWIRHTEHLRTRYKELGATIDERGATREVRRRRERKRNVSHTPPIARSYSQGRSAI